MDAESEVPVYDVLVIGAGLSGINAAYRLQTMMPECSFTILEARHCLGGTWSYWQYPGVRSDSDMGLFALPWHPWPHNVAIAAAPLISAYLEDAARTHGIDARVRFGHRATAASWDSQEQCWTVDVTGSPPDGGGGEGTNGAAHADSGAVLPSRKRIKAWFILNCGGYYAYDKPLSTTIPGLDRFKGEVLHPQFWPAETQLAGKRVVLIGSGATAVTMLPALVDAEVDRVTMLQRSPSYVLAIPGSADPVTRALRSWVPGGWAAWTVWWWHMFQEIVFVGLVTTFPNFGRWLLTKLARAQLPKGFDVEKHFRPAYDPFEQRLCFSPDGDFFAALKRPNCEVVTDEIEAVTEHSVRTKSGATIPADMIVTATGLHMRVFGSFQTVLDGVPFDASRVSDRYVWNGVMIEGVPNAGSVIGYIRGTWTPGADVRTMLLIRLMRRMRKDGSAVAVPVIDPEERQKLPRKPALPNSSTYLVNARKRLPMVADVGPWRNRGTWLKDWLFLWFGDKKDGLRFTARKGSNGMATGKAKVL